jgi:hypothetical protein
MNQQTTAAADARIDPDLLTADQVVDRLLKFPRLRQLTATCVLPAVRVDNEWRFRRDELEAWIARNV